MSGSGYLARLKDLSVHLVVIAAITAVIGTIAHGRGGPTAGRGAQAVEMSGHTDGCRLCERLARRAATRTTAAAGGLEAEASPGEETTPDHAHF